ncbi:MAG: Hsp33 family molecular chaperone HslO [Eubacteriales bacterium]|nr:Hsp33 family molecular chaperone HslO [Eubacteriales bacterium]
MSDHIVRATAAENRIRAFAASTRDLVEEARARHNTSPVVTAALGRLLTASAMMGVTLKREDERLTLKIEGDGPVKMLIAQSDAHANVRGYAAEPCVLLGANAKGKLDVAGAVGKGVLRVTRQGSEGEPFTGTSELVSGEIAEDLTYYYALSEQTPSAVALGVLMNHDNTVRAAGGFIIQLLPGADEELTAALEARLSVLPPVTTLLAEGRSAEELLREALAGFDVTVNETIPARFHCGCTRESVERVLLSLGYDELSLLAGKPVEVHCDYCSSDYEYTAEEVEKLLKTLQKEKQV